jgi:multimeric flavodoxin WrbA
MGRGMYKGIGRVKIFRRMSYMKKDIKVVGVISSARFNGNTATLVREALKGAEESGATVTEIFLPKKRIEFCAGCNTCMSSGKCVFKDDFEEVRDLLYDADGIIWGSPTYGLAINAIMKNLIDRLGQYERFTSSLGGKYMVGISTCGGTGAKKVAKGLADFACSSLFKRGYNSGMLGVSIGAKDISKETKTLEKARGLGRKITKDIKNENKYPLQNLFGRLINVFLKATYSTVILKFKEDRMKAVYMNLTQRGLI